MDIQALLGHHNRHHPDGHLRGAGADGSDCFTAMIYEPNTTKWTVGALVIHDCDAKRVDMLTRVIGYDRVSGECKTCYVYQMDDEVWLNDVSPINFPVIRTIGWAGQAKIA